MKKLGGIYEIKNIESGKRYIGSACNFLVRWKNHRNELNRSVHDNSHLQNAWNKYSEDAFEFNVLLVCDKNNNILYEQAFLDKMCPTYNIAKNATAPMLGLHHTKETCAKLSAINKGKIFSKEHKRKLSMAQKGKKASEEVRLKMSKARKGKKFTEEHKRNLSASLRGRVFTEESKMKMSEAQKGRIPWNKGKHRSEETKRKISDAHKGKILTKEHKRKISISLIGNKRSLGYKHTEETLVKMSAAQKLSWIRR